jgi:hypothetical protein
MIQRFVIKQFNSQKVEKLRIKAGHFTGMFFRQKLILRIFCRFAGRKIEFHFVAIRVSIL